MGGAATDPLTTGRGDPRCPLRVLMLAIAFPRPNLPEFAVWALKQAQAIQRQGVEIEVVSLVPWLPRFLARRSATARKHIGCPPSHDWRGLHVAYPRWPLYQFGRLKRQSMKNPGPQQVIAWCFARCRLLHEVRRFRPDVIYAHHTWTNGDLARRLKRLTGIPYVVTDHDFGEIESCARYPARRAYFRRVMGNAFCTVAVARRMEDSMRRCISEGARACTVYNGADPMPPGILERPRPPELQGKLVVLSAGLFYPRKGFPKLVEAFARVAPNFPSAVLRICGDGQDRPAVEKAVRESGVGPRVSLLGMQPHERVLQEMAWCDVFALIGRDEPFATVFSEAMSAEKPIIWPSDSGHAEVLADRINGCVVPPLAAAEAAAALASLLGNAEDRGRFGAANRALLESRFTWDANARAMVDLFGAACTAAAYRPHTLCSSAASSRP